MKALVTGCAGFIGSHLAERLLEERYEVIGIDCFLDYYPREIKEKNIEKCLENKNFKLIEGNLISLDLKKILEGIDCVFHEAAQPGVRASWGESFEIYASNNVLATQKLLEACKEAEIKKFVYASSSSIYGNAEKLPVKENELPKPISPYGVSKLAGEHLCYLYWKNFNIPVISLRYFTVFGERQRPDMAFNKFIKAVIENKEISVYGTGKQTRDFTYVSDVCEANVLAAESKIEGEVFNIGGGARIPLAKAIGIIETLAHKKMKIKKEEKQKGDVADTYADISKARKMLKYSPKVKIEEGLRRQFLWQSKRLKAAHK